MSTPVSAAGKFPQIRAVYSWRHKCWLVRGHWYGYRYDHAERCWHTVGIVERTRRS